MLSFFMGIITTRYGIPEDAKDANSTLIKLSIKATSLSEFFLLLTDGGEGVRETEVVHGVERQQVEQKLLPFFLAEQEGMRSVQLSVRGNPVRKATNKQKLTA